jgi:hypothetical protein
MRTLRVALLGVGLGLAACGASSSESPWPVEPLDAVHGPKGELLPGREASDLAAPSSAEEGSGAEGEGTGPEPQGEGAVRAGAKTDEDASSALDIDEQPGGVEGQGGGRASDARSKRGATRRGRSGGR